MLVYTYQYDFVHVTPVDIHIMQNTLYCMLHFVVSCVMTIMFYVHSFGEEELGKM